MTTASIEKQIKGAPAAELCSDELHVGPMGL